MATDSENFVGLAVGVFVGLTFLLCCCGGSICGCLFLCSRKRHPPQTHVVATTPATGPTVVSTTESNTPTAYPMQLPLSPYSPQPSPTVYPTQPPSPVAAYPPQPQMMYQNAQFSPGLAPPSYDSATSYPSAVRIFALPLKFSKHDLVTASTNGDVQLKEMLIAGSSLKSSGPLPSPADFSIPSPADGSLSSWATVSPLWWISSSISKPVLPFLGHCPVTYKQCCPACRIYP